MIRILTTASCLGLTLAAAAASGQEASPAPRDELMARCAQIEADAARLACFDLVMRGGEAEARRAIGEAGRAERAAAVRTGPARQPAAPQSDAASAEMQTAAPSPGASPGAHSADTFGQGDNGGLNLPGLPSIFMPDLSGFGRALDNSGADLADAESETGAVLPDTQVLERDEDGDPDRVLMVVDRISTFGYNTKRFHMANGQVWEVTDGMRFSVPRNADPLTAEIRTAGAGGYFLRLEGEGRAIRVRRID